MPEAAHRNTVGVGVGSIAAAFAGLAAADSWEGTARALTVVLAVAFAALAVGAFVLATVQFVGYRRSRKWWEVDALLRDGGRLLDYSSAGGPHLTVSPDLRGQAKVWVGDVRSALKNTLGHDGGFSPSLDIKDDSIRGYVEFIETRIEQLRSIRKEDD